jgi:drug/metabolite transporter (DMT)-like permease
MTKITGPHSPRAIGIGLVLVSALIFSTAGLFTKGVLAGAWDIIFWRGLFAALFTTVYILWRGSFRADFINMGRSGWAAALVGASSTAAFIPALKLTSIANVSLIYAASPLLAAILAWAWVGEGLTRRVLVGCAAAFVGVAIIVGGSIGGVYLQGDLLAGWMTFTWAILVVIYRRYPNTPAAGPAAMSSLALLPLGFTFGTPFSNPPAEIAIMVAFGLVFAMASVTLSEGAKRLPAGETALLGTLEIPLAPLFAWMVFMELPAFATVAGGLLVLAGVVSTQLPSRTKAGANGNRT